MKCQEKFSIRQNRIKSATAGCGEILPERPPSGKARVCRTFSVFAEGAARTLDAEGGIGYDKEGDEKMTDEEYMREALRLAREAAAEGEVPVGCVVADGERIVGRGRNRREKAKNALCHAELEAIDEACRTLGGWRLWKCTLYVTLEPCPMCAGAMINARIPRVVYGAADAKAGSCGSLTNLFALPYNHRPAVQGGVLEEECRALLTAFFQELRRNPAPKAWQKK